MTFVDQIVLLPLPPVQPPLRPPLPPIPPVPPVLRPLPPLAQGVGLKVSIANAIYSTTGGPTDSVVFYAVASETGYVGQIYLDGYSADTYIGCYGNG